MSEPQRSRSALVNVLFHDGRYDFQLRIGELITLQEKRNQGPAHILQSLYTTGWFVQDLLEVIRLGLIGGGMAPPAAFQLTEQVVRSAYLMELRPTAITVLEAALYGVEDEPKPGESEAPSKPPETVTPSDESGGEPSTNSPEPQAAASKNSSD